MRSRGFTSFLALALLVLTAGATLLALRATTASVISSKDQVLRRKLESKAINSLLNTLAASSPISSVECYLSAEPLAKRSGCRVSESPDQDGTVQRIQGISADKLYDYESLFKDATACAPTNNPVAFFPSPRSAISALGCELSGTLRANIAHYGNITVNSAIQIGVPVSHQVSHQAKPLCIVAASGYIHSSAEITANCDLLILAGGDLLLHSVTTSSFGERNLTLHSATGTVEVGSIAGFARVSVISAHTPTIPDLSSYLPSQIAVPLLDRQIIGIGLNSQPG